QSTLSDFSGLSLGSSIVAAWAIGFVPPVMKGCGNVAEAAGSGATKPSVPMRNTLLGFTAVEAQMPGPPGVAGICELAQLTDCSNPTSSNGTSTRFRPFRLR